ncbi:MULTISPECIES: hypothetical protein [unclassified Streptomyces]|uniref:hypothetical protein n=1 Tax=unclassified Streptomyces TaxID=2593676 RepID=UPI00380598A6
MTRYDYPGAPARRDDGRGAPVFALVRAWVAGTVVLLFTEYLRLSLIHGHLTAGADGPETFPGRLMLIHLPNAACIAAAAWAAGRVHRDPFRDHALQHMPAAFTVPAVAQALTMALQWGELTAEGVLMSNAVLVVGCVAGYAADRLQEG